jgi:hypothetical protein
MCVPCNKEGIYCQVPFCICGPAGGLPATSAFSNACRSRPQSEFRVSLAAASDAEASGNAPQQTPPTEQAPLPPQQISPAAQTWAGLSTPQPPQFSGSVKGLTQ